MLIRGFSFCGQPAFENEAGKATSPFVPAMFTPAGSPLPGWVLTQCRTFRGTQRGGQRTRFRGLCVISGDQGRLPCPSLPVPSGGFTVLQHVTSQLGVTEGPFRALLLSFLLTSLERTKMLGCLVFSVQVERLPVQGRAPPNVRFSN